MLSVLMATYSGEAASALDACLNSLAQQTRTADQIVLVRDGLLTSELEKTIQKYQATLPLECHDYEGNDRLAGALNFGLKFCSGEFIARMDSDDIAVATRFEKQLIDIQTLGADVLGAAICEFGCDVDDVRSIRRCPEIVCEGDIVARNPFNHMTVLFRKSSVIDVGGYMPLEGFEDWYLWLRLFHNGANLRNSEEQLVFARVGNEFLSRRKGLKYAIREYSALRRFYSEGLINFTQMAKGIILRIPVRLAPAKVVETFYSRLLR